jgi:hypothetical protein
VRRIGEWLLCAWALAAASAAAQERSTFVVSLAGGAAGAWDDEVSSDFGHGAAQASFAMYTDERTLTIVRVGRLDLGDGLSEAGLEAAELDYATVAGEVRWRQPAYDFGLALGVGAYRLEGELAGARSEQSELGAVLAFTGDFDLTRRLSVVAEADIHYAFFDDVRIYGAALVGVAIHF